eukprot:scpid111519/ scgid32143/ 
MRLYSAVDAGPIPPLAYMTAGTKDACSTQLPSHPATQSPCHGVTQSTSHGVTQSVNGSHLTQSGNDNAYRPNLPTTLPCHPVFNVTALKPYEADAIHGRRQPPEPTTDLDGNTGFIVEKILDHGVC